MSAPLMTQAKLDSIDRKILRAKKQLELALAEADATWRVDATVYSLEDALYMAIARARTAHIAVNHERRNNADCGTHITLNGQRPRCAPKPAPVAMLGEVKP